MNLLASLRKRPVLILGLLPAFLLVSGGGVLAWQTTHLRTRIDEEVYHRIASCQTLEEVEQIIGAPPGDYGMGDAIPMMFVAFPNIHFYGEGFERNDWIGQDYYIRVVLHNGRICGTEGGEVFRANVTWFDRLRRILRL